MCLSLDQVHPCRQPVVSNPNSRRNQARRSVVATTRLHTGDGRSTGRTSLGRSLRPGRRGGGRSRWADLPRRHLSTDETEIRLGTAMDWGCYGALFDLDTDTGELVLADVPPICNLHINDRPHGSRPCPAALRVWTRPLPAPRPSR